MKFNILQMKYFQIFAAKVAQMWSQEIKNLRGDKIKKKKKLRGENFGGSFLCTLNHVVL